MGSATTSARSTAARPGLGDEGFRAKRARRIAILNQKGGTGKTTTAVNLAAGLAEREHEVLLIDTDAQGNVGVSLGVAGEKSLYHVLVDGAEPTEVAVPVRKPPRRHHRGRHARRRRDLARAPEHRPALAGPDQAPEPDAGRRGATTT